MTCDSFTHYNLLTFKTGGFDDTFISWGIGQWSPDTDFVIRNYNTNVNAITVDWVTNLVTVQAAALINGNLTYNGSTVMTGYGNTYNVSSDAHTIFNKAPGNYWNYFQFRYDNSAEWAFGQDSGRNMMIGNYNGGWSGALFWVSWLDDSVNIAKDLNVTGSINVGSFNPSVLNITSDAAEKLILTNTVNNTNQITFAGNTGTNWTITTDTGYFRINNQATAQIPFSISSSDDVSFYNKVTCQTMQANAGITSSSVYTNLISDRVVQVKNTGEFGTTSSSVRFKENINPMMNTSFIYDLNPVNFTYKVDNGEITRFGLIAEEVEQVSGGEHLVGHDKEGRVDYVGYDRLVPMLLNELQKLKSEFDSFKKGRND